MAVRPAVRIQKKSRKHPILVIQEWFPFLSVQIIVAPSPIVVRLGVGEEESTDNWEQSQRFIAQPIEIMRALLK